MNSGPHSPAGDVDHMKANRANRGLQFQRNTKTWTRSRVEPIYCRADPVQN